MYGKSQTNKGKYEVWKTQREEGRGESERERERERDSLFPQFVVGCVYVCDFLAARELEGNIAIYVSQS